MKSSLKKLRGFALNKNDPRERRGNRAPAHIDELIQASEDMSDMKDCYDNLLSAAAATANSAYEFSEALREMGTCLLEKTALNDDEESGRVLLMMGKVQFELQKLVDSYRVHIIQTITTPSESLLKELQTVEEMKRQCDDKRDVYKYILAAQNEKGKSRSSKGESFSLQQLQEAKEDYEEEANLFVFRLKSLKQGQSHSLLTQAARHHAAQLNFFRKGVKSLELVEPHVKVVAEQRHIDYQFSGLEDDYTEDDNDNSDDYDGNADGELSFDYGANDQGQDVVSLSRNSMEEGLDRSQIDFASFTRRPRSVSQSAPILANKFESSERIDLIRPSSTRKSNTYVLPTPADTKRSPSPPEPNRLVKDIKNERSGPPRIPKAQSILKESNTNSGLIKLPLPLAEGFSLSQFDFHSTSETNKKIKRPSYSGPLTTNKTWSSKSTSSAGENPPRISLQQSLSPKVSPSVSPPTLSPRISEVHKLPRPPTISQKPTRPSSLVGHSAPLVPRAQEFHSVTKKPTVPLQKGSPLPTPPVIMARSFSIPSSGQRIPTKLLDHHTDMNKDSSSPTLTPISLTSNQSASEQSRYIY
ncbi:uncharacterized protein A4U43_C10F4390 [Asparagus officinalis]|uniref:BAR domain-containing protein n=1 Tax=Asparagus officinalis TaxID=4686 RepID=A0A5P1E524_ASPOF|nr:uncharacterized protein At2g33490-like [Asparagus officinalis]ONK56126.1 uncharacterized protein A4U43_C10F4390 [Asparagus officinalis]